MNGSERTGVAVHHLRCGFADDEVHDDALIAALVFREILLGHTLQKPTDFQCSTLHMIGVSQAVDYRPYRLRLLEYLGALLLRQVLRCQDINLDTQQRLQFILQTAQVEKGCTG